MNFTKLYKYGGTKMKIRVYWKDIEFLEVEKKNELYFSKINVENPDSLKFYLSGNSTAAYASSYECSCNEHSWNGIYVI